MRNFGVVPHLYNPVAIPTGDAFERFWRELSDRYRYERELGQGGMSTVYLARDLKLDRLVAVKVLRPEYATAVGTERFLREIHITAQLQHPNILTLLDSGEALGLVYYVMPYVEGETVRERLTWTKPLPVVEAVRIARAVANALNYAHSRGVVHRDIKPENILLSNGNPIVADFGVARAVSGAASPNLTVGGMAIGTPAYMSPEQARGHQDVDGRSDLYALGCVLYEMLTGEPPFSGLSPEAVMQRHLHEAPRPLSELRPGLTPELSGAVLRALAKRPEDRYRTAEELERELRVFLASEVLQQATPERGLAPQHGFTPQPVTPWQGHAARSGEATLSSGVRPARRWIAAGIGVAAFAVAVLLLAPRAARTTAKPAARFSASIAALPLDNIGADEQGAYLSEGLTEEIIAQLSRIEGLKVISRTSAVAVKAKKLTVPQIAKELDVKHVLEGSVQRSGNRIRITLQLIEAKTDAHVWAQTFERELTDIFSLREEIATKVTGALAASLNPGGPATAPAAAPAASTGSTTRICSAYDAYLQGKYWLQRPSEKMLRDGITAFETSIRTDDAYAPAYSGLSVALRLWVQLGYDSKDPYGEYARSARLADQAIARDPGLPDGWGARGAIRAFAWAPPADALADLEKAAALSPSSGPFVAFHGIGLARAGRYDDAMAQMERGAELDPLCPSIRSGIVALTALGGRRYDVAVRESRLAARIDPGFSLSHVIEAIGLVLAGRAEEAAALDLSIWPIARALVLEARGQTAEAAALAATVRRQVDPAHGAAAAPAFGMLACYHAYRGDVPLTVDALERAFAASPGGLDFRFLDSGLFDKVRGDPRFKSALDRISGSVRERVFPPAARS